MRSLCSHACMAFSASRRAVQTTNACLRVSLPDGYKFFQTDMVPSVLSMERLSDRLFSTE